MQHWFRQWLGAEQAESHYLKQCWPSSLTHICVVGFACSLLFYQANYLLVDLTCILPFSRHIAFTQWMHPFRFCSIFRKLQLARFEWMLFLDNAKFDENLSKLADRMRLQMTQDVKNVPFGPGHTVHSELTQLLPRNVMRWHCALSILSQVTARCLTKPSHYLNQCWLIINEVQWHSSEGNFIKDTSTTS